jgi:hypothetical protein
LYIQILMFLDSRREDKRFWTSKKKLIYINEVCILCHVTVFFYCEHFF